MDNETHFSIVFNIYGGSNQILPNATSATQNYYGDEAELEKDDVSKEKEPALSPEATRLFSYINKVVDFTHIKETVMGRLDHQNLNEVVSLNPTAENIARWVCEQIPTCFKVEVRESEGNTVIYEKD